MDDHLSTLVSEIAERLSGHSIKISIAEACTGGYLSNAITDASIASQFFVLAVVSDSEPAIKTVLGLKSSAIKKNGIVSEEAAIEMVEALTEVGHTDVSLSVTGNPGPERIEDKDVGLVFIAAKVRGHTESQGFKFSGSKEDIKRQASIEALQFLKRVLDIWL